MKFLTKIVTSTNLQNHYLSTGPFHQSIHMKHYTFHITVLLFYNCILGIRTYGQTECDTIKYPPLLNNSYQCRWNFLELEDTIEGKIIEFNPMPLLCGVFATASIYIIQLETDTIRVISLCDTKKRWLRKRIRIFPDKGPDFQVHIPFYNYESVDIAGNKNFDATVLRTTWGYIEKRQKKVTSR